MSELTNQKAKIEAEFSQIAQTNKIIAERLREAKASGDENGYDVLIGKLRIMKDREENLQILSLGISAPKVSASSLSSESNDIYKEFLPE